MTFLDNEINSILRQVETSIQNLQGFFSICSNDVDIAYEKIIPESPDIGAIRLRDISSDKSAIIAFTCACEKKEKNLIVRQFGLLLTAMGYEVFIESKPIGELSYIEVGKVDNIITFLTYINVIHIKSIDYSGYNKLILKSHATELDYTEVFDFEDIDLHRAQRLYPSYGDGTLINFIKVSLSFILAAKGKIVKIEDMNAEVNKYGLANTDDTHIQNLPFWKSCANIIGKDKIENFVNITYHSNEAQDNPDESIRFTSRVNINHESQNITHTDVCGQIVSGTKGDVCSVDRVARKGYLKVKEHVLYKRNIEHAVYTEKDIEKTLSKLILNHVLDFGLSFMNVEIISIRLASSSKILLSGVVSS